MFRGQQEQTLAFTCQKTGEIASVLFDIHNYLGPSGQPQILRETMSPEVHTRYISFLSKVSERYFSLEKNITFHNAQESPSFTLLGVQEKDRTFVIAIQSSSSVAVVYDELMRVINEQARMLRDTQQRMRRQESGMNPSNVLEDYMRINNELVDMKRAMERKNRQLEEAAITDTLTGVANRRRLFEVLEAEIAKANRYKTPLAVIMMDIDHFKKVNDKYGHATGDELLSEVADLMCRTVRDVDLVGRYGGEEFAVIMPNTTSKGACLLAERIRAAIEAAAFCHGKLRTAISAGVAEYELHTPVSLLDTADKRLYRAKETGRNRVVCHSFPDNPPAE